MLTYQRNVVDFDDIKRSKIDFAMFSGVLFEGTSLVPMWKLYDWDYLSKHVIGYTSICFTMGRTDKYLRVFSFTWNVIPVDMLDYAVSNYIYPLCTWWFLLIFIIYIISANIILDCFWVAKAISVILVILINPTLVFVVLGKLLPSPNSNAKPKPNPDPDRGQFSGQWIFHFELFLIWLYPYDDLKIFTADLGKVGHDRACLKDHIQIKVVQFDVSPKRKNFLYMQLRENTTYSLEIK